MDVTDTYHMQLEKKVPNAVEVVVKVKSIFWKLSQNAFSKVKNGCNLQMTFIFFNVVVNSFLANYICSFVTFFYVAYQFVLS